MIAELIDPAILGFILVGVMLFAIFRWISNFIYINFFRFCIWLSRIWKISFLFNDLQFSMVMTEQTLAAVPTLCLYGNYDGTSWINGKIVFSIPNDVS